jgi:hypothetical protein
MLDRPTPDSLICWLVILSIFVLLIIFLSTFITFAYNICYSIYPRNIYLNYLSYSPSYE